MQTFFSKLKSTVFGEFLDELEIGKEFQRALSLPETDNADQLEEKAGLDRLGSKDIMSSMGATFIVAALVLLLIILITTVVIFFVRRSSRQCSSKCKERATSLKDKVFYNAMIRFAFVSALKLNLSAMVAMQEFFFLDTGKQIVTAITFIAINLMPLVFARVLYKRAGKLEHPDNSKIKTLFAGRRVDSGSEHRVWIYPLVFFGRRYIFIFVSVYHIESPALQIVCQQVLIMASLIYISHSDQMFTSKLTQCIEIATEVLLFVATQLLQAFMLSAQYSELGIQRLEQAFYVAFTLLLVLNLLFMVYSLYDARQKSKRKRKLQANQLAYDHFIAANYKLYKEMNKMDRECHKTQSSNTSSYDSADAAEDQGAQQIEQVGGDSRHSQKDNTAVELDVQSPSKERHPRRIGNSFESQLQFSQSNIDQTHHDFLAQSMSARSDREKCDDLVNQSRIIYDANSKNIPIPRFWEKP